ncbi:hypothetical protein MMC30_008747 [Trapelia coarctata]|nr:hypothetical protein [Trapelia coarctata]
MWAEHEFNKHRLSRSWCCPECREGFTNAQELEEHLKEYHTGAFTPAQLPLVLSAAETRSAVPIETQQCPLCKIIPGTSQRNFVKHVGRHLESIALATLPRETEDESDQDSIASSDGGQPVTGLTSPLPLPFFVPPDFCHRTSLAGRDRELEQLDYMLFKKRRTHGTTPVLIYGEPGSGKTQLVERYIELNGMKFKGGVFWINYRSREEVHHVLRCIALEHMKNYSPGPDITLETLMRAVRNWFESFGDWLVVLNDLPQRWDLIGDPRRSAFPIFCTVRPQSSLIYISSSDQVLGSALPENPDGLEIFPLNDTRHSSPELDLKKLPSSMAQGRITNFGGPGTIRPYTCVQPECRHLQGFTHPGGLGRHHRQVHLTWGFNEDLMEIMPLRRKSAQS